MDSVTIELNCPGLASLKHLHKPSPFEQDYVRRRLNRWSHTRVAKTASLSSGFCSATSRKNGQGLHRTSHGRLRDHMAPHGDLPHPAASWSRSFPSQWSFLFAYLHISCLRCSSPLVLLLGPLDIVSIASQLRRACAAGFVWHDSRILKFLAPHSKAQPHEKPDGVFKSLSCTQALRAQQPQPLKMQRGIKGPMVPPDRRLDLQRPHLR